MQINYYDKYIKYKNKYISLNNQNGGLPPLTQNPQLSKTINSIKSVSMSSLSEKIIKPKLGLLELAKQLGNV